MIMMNKLLCALEAILLSCADAVSAEEIARALDVSPQAARDLALSLSEEYDNSKRGFKIIKIEDGFQICSREDYYDYIRSVTQPRRKQGLSMAALETLSIVAYNQPITRSRVEFIRGVDCTGSIQRLCERGLIDEVGRMDTPGKPILYGTTDEFLRCFGLESIADLPELSAPPKQESFLEDSEAQK